MVYHLLLDMRAFDGFGKHRHMGEERARSQLTKGGRSSRRTKVHGRMGREYVCEVGLGCWAV